MLLLKVAPVDSCFGRGGTKLSFKAVSPGGLLFKADQADGEQSGDQTVLL